MAYAALSRRSSTELPNVRKSSQNHGRSKELDLEFDVRRLHSSHAHVLKSHGAQANSIQNILRIYDQRATQQVLDFCEIESTKFRPAGPYDQGFNSFGCGVSRLAVVDR